MSERIARLQEALAENDFDAMVLNPSATMTYLTGHSFDSHERLFLLLVPRSGAPVAVVPALEEGNWRAAVPAVDRLFLWDDVDGPEQAAGEAFAALGSVGTVAVEPLACRFMEAEHIRRCLPGAALRAGEAIVDALRLHKDRDEANAIRRAAEIAEAALVHVLQGVRVGKTEAEIAAELSSELLRRGGGGISFGPIVLGGPQSALPHGVPGDRPLGAGELLLIDFGTSWGGYHSDITRTFVVGSEPNERTREVYEAVLESNRNGLAATRAGVTSGEVHDACQRNLHTDQWSEFFKHRTGHGLGLEIHEPPSIMSGSPTVLEEGMVFTVEPGLYLEGWGGVRIEDDLWVTADGHECLTSYPKELQVVGR